MYGTFSFALSWLFVDTQRLDRSIIPFTETQTTLSGDYRSIIGLMLNIYMMEINLTQPAHTESNNIAIAT